MKYIIAILGLLIGNSNYMAPKPTHLDLESQIEIIGTWKTIPVEYANRPKFEVVIGKNSMYITRTDIGSWGYTQLLTYKIYDDTIYAKEKEFMSFDQNVGYIISHFKYRNKDVILKLTDTKEKIVMTLIPLEPGRVLFKASNDTLMTYNFTEQLSKWRLGKDFKCDYKKNGRPITSAVVNGGFRSE